MNADEIDKIIAEAVADSKNQGKSKRTRGKRNGDSIVKARKALNWAFMIGFLATIVIYFVLPEQKSLFFSLGFGSILLKLIEFYLRFMF